MPMTIVHGTDARKPTVDGKTLGFFTGQVYIQPYLSTDDRSCAIADVNFTPSARTKWHKHEGGQLLRVLAGSGWVCDKGDKPKKLNVGDVVWCPPGTTHWHGADDGCYMVHQAVSHGGVEWFEEVGDGEYGQKAA